MFYPSFWLSILAAWVRDNKMWEKKKAGLSKLSSMCSSEPRSLSTAGEWGIWVNKYIMIARNLHSQKSSYHELSNWGLGRISTCPALAWHHPTTQVTSKVTLGRGSWGYDQECTGQQSSLPRIHMRKRKAGKISPTTKEIQNYSPNAAAFFFCFK